MNWPEVKKDFGKKIPPTVVCHQEGERILCDKVPIALRVFVLYSLTDSGCAWGRLDYSFHTKQCGKGRSRKIQYAC